jgi:prepilin-type N-terminal cleavage/methylation domain-containing protein
MRSRGPHRRGFTLVEAIATMAILGAVGAAASGLILTATRSYTDAAFAAQLQAEASAAMDRMMRELRWIRIDPDSAAPVPIVSQVTATSISFNGNWSLSYSGGQVQLVENGGTAMVLLSDVSAFSISTFDQDGSALGATLSGAECGAIRRIQVQFTLTRSGASQTLRSRCFIRGMMQGA